MAQIIITTATATTTITTTNEMIAIYHDHIEVIPTANATKADVAPAQTADATEADVAPAQIADATEKQVEAYDTTKQTADATEADVATAQIADATEQTEETAKDGVPAAAKLAVDPRLQEAEFVKNAKKMLVELLKYNTAKNKTIFADEFWVLEKLEEIRDAKRIAILSDGKEEVVYDDILSNDKAKAIEKLLEKAITLVPYYEDSISDGFCFKPSNVGQLAQQKRWDLVWN